MDPRSDAAEIGGYATTTLTTSWVDLGSDDFSDLQVTTGTGLTAGLVFRHLSVQNTHATQVVYVMLAAGAGAVSDRIPVLAGTTREIPVMGPNITTISIQASGASTTAHVLAYCVPR